MEQNDNKPKQTPNCNYSIVHPTPLLNPRTVSISEIACKILDIEKKDTCEDSDTAMYLSGNRLLEGSVPISHCYCGYQFGVFAGQLGDGRAITLGDLYNSKNELWELQLKGSGKTPYSRFADGRAVLRSTIREYLCSEHLFTLGIPTTRALGMTVSDSKVVRDLLYDNNPIMEKCAVILRLCNTFQRFGTFEIFKGFDSMSGAKGPSEGKEKEMMPKMVVYLLKYHYSNLYKKWDIKDNSNEIPSDCMKDLYSLIMSRTAFLVATWQAFGYCHGVLNTDNMSILGVTIDFGPYGFMEFFDKDHLCNHSDKNGRYSYRSQPSICYWNLQKLSEAWNYLIPKDETIQILKEKYFKIFNDCYYNIMRFKLGLFLKNEREQDKSLIDDMSTLLDEYGLDYTNFLRNLSIITVEENFKENGVLNNLDLDFIDLMMEYSMNYDFILDKIRPKLNPHLLEKLIEICNQNPIILHSYGLDPESIESEYKKLLKFNQMKESKMTDEQYEINKRKKLIEWVTRYKYRLTKEAQYFIQLKSNSTKDEFFNLNENFLVTNNITNIQPFSEFIFRDIYSKIYENLLPEKFSSLTEFINKRIIQMKSLNPKFILRNHLAQKVISEADNNNFKELDKLLSILIDPFSEHHELEDEKLYSTSLEKAFSVCVSCSS